MIYVFWWSGRGYLTPVIILATLSGFGIVLQASRPLLADSAWFWGIGLLVAAALNWHFGTRANQKKLATIKTKTMKDRLLYRARHRFMALPMETFSLVIAVFSVGTITYGLLQPH